MFKLVFGWDEYLYFLFWLLLLADLKIAIGWGFKKI